MKHSTRVRARQLGRLAGLLFVLALLCVYVGVIAWAVAAVVFSAFPTL
jgi:hypothetical protein